MREFNAIELDAYLESAEDRPLLLDVRQPWEYEICRLEDSLLIPMGHIPMHVDTMEKDRETVVICHHGIRSRQVAFFLEQSGFSNVINLKGGVNDWAHHVDTSMATY